LPDLYNLYLFNQSTTVKLSGGGSDFEQQQMQLNNYAISEVNVIFYILLSRRVIN